MIILDTDHLSVFARSEGTAATKLRQRIIDHHRSTGELFAVTAISLEEQMRGWLARIGGQRDALRQVESYERLVELVDFIRNGRSRSSTIHRRVDTRYCDEQRFESAQWI